MKSCRFIFLLSVLLIIFISCERLKKAKNVFETSERIKYERSFSGADSLMAQWKAGFSSAASGKLKINSGTSFTVNAEKPVVGALGYSVELEKGTQLIIETDIIHSGKKIFIDLFDQASGTEIMKSAVIENNRFSKPVGKSGWYRLVIQPEIAFNGIFKMKIYTQPSLHFPVAGKGNHNVQSLWGANRDGGARRHEGVDIFASKGTPVVAVTDGYITRTGNQGLGGKQVWLRDAILGNSYYYAHLDSILTEGGKQVKTGDTLGLVGNTGNAAGGATHLHFGIYTSGGATDPYPYIRKQAIPKFSKQPEKAKFSAKYVKAGSNLRSGPGTQYEVLSTANAKISAEILASSGSWYHVKTSEGIQGFIIADRLE